MKKSGYTFAKRTIYFLGVLTPLALVVLPGFFVLEDERAKIFISLTGFLVLGLVFAIEEIKVSLMERHEQLVHKVESLHGSLQNDAIHKSIRIIQESGDPIFYRHVCGNVDDLRGRLKQAELGVLELDEGERASLPLELADSVTKGLLATSVWNDDPIAAKKRAAYLQRLAMARQVRNVTVKRLFIVSEGDVESAAFQKRVSEEKGNNFASRYIFASAWIKTERVSRPCDFGVWDDTRVWLYTGDKDAVSLRHKAELHNSRNVVEAYRRAFELNWDEATELS